MQHFLKIGGKRYGEVRNFKKVRKFASSNLKFRSSKFKFTEILICNPGERHRRARGEHHAVLARPEERDVTVRARGGQALRDDRAAVAVLVERFDIEPFSDFSAK